MSGHDRKHHDGRSAPITELPSVRGLASATEIVEVISVALQQHVPPSAQQAAAHDVRDALMDHFGAGPLHLPSPHMLRLAARDRDIWEAFDGRNYAALAARYQLTERRVRQIILQQRDLHTRRGGADE